MFYRDPKSGTDQMTALTQRCTMLVRKMCDRLIDQFESGFEAWVNELLENGVLEKHIMDRCGYVRYVARDTGIVFIVPADSDMAQVDTFDMETMKALYPWRDFGLTPQRPSSFGAEAAYAWDAWAWYYRN